MRIECEMRNGHPWSVGGIDWDGRLSGADGRLFDEMEPEEQETVRKWIREGLKPRKTPTMRFTSYGMKHWLEDATGIYMTNNQFKDAMLEAGFEPVVVNELNWHFRVSMRSPAVKERYRVVPYYMRVR